MKTGSPSSSSFKFLNLSHYNEAHNRRLRVADILISDDNDDEEEEEINCEDQVIMGDGRRRKEACRSFGVILCRWLSFLRRGKRKRKGEAAATAVVEREGREKDGGESGGGSTRTRCSMNGLSGDSTAALMVEERKGDSEGSCESERYRKEASFNLGVGFGLIYLMAMSRNELSEMIELQKHMEILLQNGKEELHLHRKDKCSKAPESSNSVAYSTTYVEESVNNNGCLSVQNSSESHILPYFESTMKPNQALNNGMPREEECVEGIDQLEAEFEAELERLQLRLDIPIDHREERIEVAVEETAPGGSLSASFGEVIDFHEAYAERDCGVPPDELKIRLHELLQEKQEERIKELEAALGRAKQKLREKEMEVSWWKDTAHLISSRRAVKSYDLLPTA